jgi:translocation and assembly module TamB
MAPDGTARVDFDAALTRLERLIPTLTGTATAKGSAERSPAGAWQITVAAQGPGGIAGDVAGGFDEPSGRADMRATGRLNLNLANLFVAPNSADGVANFDLTLRGQPALAALAGTITTSGASFAIPSAAQTVNNIAATVTIADGQARVLVDGGLRGAPGGFRVSGPVALVAPFDSRIAIDISGLGLTDNVIYSTSADGQLLLSGPLLGNPALSGQIVFGETDINLNAATGAAGAPPIPDIVHVAEPGPVLATRDRAGLTEQAKPGSKTAIGLDLRLIARNRVYVHGFGLQAEMAGDIAIRGSSADVQPSGQIEMIRGSLDILGRKLKLTRGIISMQGNLQPYVEFQSTASTSDGQATIEISGVIDAPEVSVFADPDRPAEEALAMLLFGNRFTELSPIVIAQMAASLARMGGAGGNGSKSLRNSTGLDTVGVETSESGTAQARAGAYLSDNVYTELTVNADGETEVNLNLDLTESLSVRGTVGNSGDTRMGVYFGRDY